MLLKINYFLTQNFFYLVIFSAGIFFLVKGFLWMLQKKEQGPTRYFFGVVAVIVTVYLVWGKWAVITPAIIISLLLAATAIKRIFSGNMREAIFYGVFALWGSLMTTIYAIVLSIWSFQMAIIAIVFVSVIGGFIINKILK